MSEDNLGAPGLEAGEEAPSDESVETAGGERRHFLVSVSALLAGTLAILAPIGAAVVTLLDPLRRGQARGDMLLVARTSAIPEDGSPRKFTVTADRTDAWAKYEDSPVGAVYLRRSGDEVHALNVVCPHAGCFVGIAQDRSRFSCPCHRSSFDLDGVVNDPTSPSPRDMDALDVEVRNGDEVWIRFQNFLPGRSEKTPV